MEDKETGAQFVHANTHIDVYSSGAAVQLAQTKYVMSFLSKFEVLPLILTADWNNDIRSTPITYILALGMSSVYDCPSLADTLPTKLIGDFMLVTKDSIEITEHVYDTSTYDSKTSSDHPAVYYEFMMTASQNG